MEKLDVMVKRLIYFALGLGLTSCIDQIDLWTGGEDPKLVIDGWISNDPEMSFVKVFFSSPMTRSTAFPIEILQVAGVYVEAEKEGAAIQFHPHLEEEVLTKYVPRTPFEFKPEERYRLNVLMFDGNHYQSDWQEVPAPYQITGFDYEISEKIIFIERVYGPPFQQKRHYLDLKAMISPSPGVNEHHYYLKSSGYEELATLSISDFCTCTCYIEIPNLADKLLAEHTDQAIPFANMGSITLSRLTRFYVKLDLYALSPNSAGYMADISQQHTNTGSIFDPAPFKISGNIKNIGNENEEVLGYFFAANHTSRDSLIRRGDIHSKYAELRMARDPLPEVGGSCLEYYTNATVTPPLPFTTPR